MKLGIMYTGGTIGCFYRPLRPMTSEEFAALFDKEIVGPVLSEEFPSLKVSYLPFGPPALDSTNIQPLDWCNIVEILLDNYADYDAFLILHGTDTMAYSAASLTFLLTGLDKDGHRDAVLDKPVILTGSQLPLFDGEDPSSANIRFNTDAFQNVCGAISCAQYGIPKVCLFFNNKLMLGTRTQKTSSNQFEAFSSPNYPPLAQVGTETMMNHGIVRQLKQTNSRDNLLSRPNVRNRLKKQLDYFRSLGNGSIRVATFEAVPARPAHLATQLRALLHLDDPDLCLQGLILESYGAGNFPSGDPEDPTKGEIYQVLKEASDKGVIILNNTSCLSGVVDSNAYAAGSWLSSIKALSAFDMVPVALYTKLRYMLMLGRRHNWSDETVRMLLTTNYTGEMIDVHCLDTFGQRELWPGESIAARDGTARLVNDLNRGPQLIVLDAETGGWASEPLWSAVPRDTEVGLTCVLRMQVDGNLVLRDSSLDTLWESGTAQQVADEPFSRLELTGLTHPAGVSLRIYNYVAHETAKQLYPPGKLISRKSDISVG